MSPQSANTSSAGPLVECCQQFGRGQFNPDSDADVRRMLRGEGVKRLDSFVFELLIQRALKYYCGHMPIAYGWYVLTNGSADAELWIRLETESPLNACDDSLLVLLNRRASSVLLVKASTDYSGFWGSWHTGERWGEEGDLIALLFDRFGQPGVEFPGRVRQPRPAPVERADAALARLFNHSTPAERRSLALSRLLINCFIVPCTGRQPMDLDAVILNDQGVLRFLEFKRKYPSRKGKFGLDSGHGTLIRWLNVTGHKLSNLVLVDPCWNKDISPQPILDEPTRAHLRWVGAHVSPDLFDAEGLSTQGEDSGMFQQERDQEAVSVSRYVVLGEGFKPKGLQAFLNETGFLPWASMENLAAVNRAALQDGSCPEKTI